MSMLNIAVPSCRSILFFSAFDMKNADDIDMAYASEADAVCVDLEDAVPKADKADARETLFSVVKDYLPPLGKILAVRINELSSDAGWADVHSLIHHPHPFNAVIVPKVDQAAETALLGKLLNEARCNASIFAIIETPAGLENALGIAQSHSKIAGLLFGGHDMATALGSDMAWEPLLYARSRVVHAAASSQVQVLDCPYLHLSDLDGLLASCGQARSVGMTGKTTKHASQVAIIQSAFTPSESDIAMAKKILELYRKDPASPVLYEGQLIELPMIKRLHQIANTA